MQLTHAWVRRSIQLKSKSNEYQFYSPKHQVSFQITGNSKINVQSKSCWWWTEQTFKIVNGNFPLRLFDYCHCLKWTGIKIDRNFGRKYIHCSIFIFLCFIFFYTYYIFIFWNATFSVRTVKGRMFSFKCELIVSRCSCFVGYKLLLQYQPVPPALPSRPPRALKRAQLLCWGLFSRGIWVSGGRMKEIKTA